MSSKAKPRTPHARLTAEHVKQNWLAGDYTASGYLFNLLKALKKDGWHLGIDDVDTFCLDWEISRRSFYRAKAKLILQGRIEEKIIGKVEIWICSNPKVVFLNEDFDDDDCDNSGVNCAKFGTSNDTSGTGNDTSGTSNDTSGTTAGSNALPIKRLQDPSTLIRSITDLDHLSLSCPPTASPKVERKEPDFVVEEKENSAVDRPQPERESDRLEPNFNQTELKQIHSSGEDLKSSAPAPKFENSFEIAEQDRDFMKWAEARSSGLQARNPKIHAQTCLKRDEDLELWQQYQARKQKPLADDREFANQSEYAAYVAKRREELLCQ